MPTTEVYLKCNCPHCEQSIEYPSEMMESTITCPNCDAHLILPKQELPSQATVPVEHHGFLNSLVEKYKEHKRHRVDVKAFVNELFLAVADGVLTEDELLSITTRQQELGLSIGFLQKRAEALLSAATKAVIRGGVCSSESYRNLSLMAQHLGRQLSDFPKLNADLVRASTKFRLRFEPLVPLNVPSVLFNNGERAYWTETGALYENRVVSRRYEGGSQGVSFRVAKGVSFRVGNHRGHIVSETADVPVSRGELVITNLRLLFIGDQKSFAAPLRKIIQLEPANDGIRFSESNRQKPRVVLFDQPNGDLCYEVLQRVVKN